MTLPEFIRLYSQLPAEVALFYSKVQREFGLTHDQAYVQTLAYARQRGLAVAQPGMPPGPGAQYRLLLAEEL